MITRAQRAQRRRRGLVVFLGGVCFFCGATSGLEFHSLEAIPRQHHNLSVGDRVTYYRRLAARGDVMLLCVRCHRNLEDWQRMVGRLLAKTYAHPRRPAHDDSYAVNVLRLAHDSFCSLARRA